MRRIAVVNLKGGSSKTTTATSLAVALARRGERVLILDADQSGNASWTVLGGQTAEPPTLADVLTRRASVEEAIRPSTVPGLDVLPADSSLGGVNVELAQQLARDTRLRSAMAPVEDAYGFAIADTGPSFTTILANVLVWAHEVIVPADPGIFAVLGLVELQATMDEVREAYGNEELHLAGLVLTRVARNNVHRDVLAELRGRYGDRVFKATIPLSSKVEESHTHAKTVVEYAPKSPAAVAYESLTDEVLSYGRTTEERGGVDVERRARKGSAA